MSAEKAGVAPPAPAPGPSVAELPVMRGRVAWMGTAFFGVGLAAFGVLHLVTGDFVAGRAPAWPEPLPGQHVWAYASGVALIVAGAAIVAGRRARLAALAAGTLICGWAFLRHLPPTAASGWLSPQWTDAGKALVLFGGSFAVAGSLPAASAGRAGASTRGYDRTFLHLGRVALGLFLLLCGVQHFLYAGFVASLVPDWIPNPYFWTYVTGVALIAGGAGLLVPSTTRLAAALSGLMIFSWVWLVHLPLIASHGAWTAPFEALAMSGLALLLAATSRAPWPDRLAGLDLLVARKAPGRPDPDPLAREQNDGPRRDGTPVR